MEKRVVNPMIIARRAFTSTTKYSTNIGMVVSSGAKRVQTTSPATEIFASSYSLSPSSWSLVNGLCLVSTLHRFPLAVDLLLYVGQQGGGICRASCLQSSVQIDLGFDARWTKQRNRALYLEIVPRFSPTYPSPVLAVMSGSPSS